MNKILRRVYARGVLWRLWVCQTGPRGSTMIQQLCRQQPRDRRSNGAPNLHPRLVAARLLLSLFMAVCVVGCVSQAQMRVPPQLDGPDGALSELTDVAVAAEILNSGPNKVRCDVFASRPKMAVYRSVVFASGPRKWVLQLGDTFLGIVLRSGTDVLSIGVLSESDIAKAVFMTVLAHHARPGAKEYTFHHFLVSLDDAPLVSELVRGSWESPTIYAQVYRVWRGEETGSRGCFGSDSPTTGPDGYDDP